MPTRSTPCERSWRDVAELPALRGEAATGGAGGTEVPLPPPDGDLSRFVSDGLWLCCTRQRRILLVLRGKEAPLCVLIS